MSADTLRGSIDDGCIPTGRAAELLERDRRIADLEAELASLREQLARVEAARHLAASVGQQAHHALISIGLTVSKELARAKAALQAELLGESSGVVPGDVAGGDGLTPSATASAEGSAGMSADFDRIWRRRKVEGGRFGQPCRMRRIVNTWLAEWEFEDGTVVLADTMSTRARKGRR